MLLVGCGAEQAMKKGDKFYALGEYYDASAQYKKAYAQLPAKERTQRGKGTLTISFNSDSDFERIMALLEK